MKKKYLRWLYVLIWMAVIFWFSSQNGVKSNHNNRFVVELFKSMGINLDVLLGSIDNFIIRKLAHMTEYFILYNLIFNAVHKKERLSKTLAISLILTFAYAGSDEIHQLFIPGRAGMFRDVLIDTSGGVIALILRAVMSTSRGAVGNKKI